MGGRTPDLNTASVALYQLSYCPRLYELGGGEEARTPGLDSAIVALYQLSYTPKLLLKYTTQTRRLSNRVLRWACVCVQGANGVSLCHNWLQAPHLDVARDEI